jgi:hypothetical protein
MHRLYYLRFSRRWLWKMPSSGMWRRVDPVKWTEVSEERIASIFRVAAAGSSLANFSALKMEAICSTETSVHFTGSTRRHIPEDGILQLNNCLLLQPFRDLANISLSTYIFVAEKPRDNRMCLLRIWSGCKQSIPRVAWTALSNSLCHAVRSLWKY